MGFKAYLTTSGDKESIHLFNGIRTVAGSALSRLQRELWECFLFVLRKAGREVIKNRQNISVKERQCSPQKE